MVYCKFRRYDHKDQFDVIIFLQIVRELLNIIAEVIDLSVCVYSFISTKLIAQLRTAKEPGPIMIKRVCRCLTVICLNRSNFVVAMAEYACVVK